MQVAVPRGHHRPRIAYPPVQVFRFEVDTFELGIAQLDAAPGEPSASTARLAPSSISCGCVIRSAMTSRSPCSAATLRARGAEPGTLLEYARALNVFGPVRAAVYGASAG